MTSSVYIGRIGGLAAALGIGAAVLTAAAVAWAAPDSRSSDSTDSSRTESAPNRGPRVTARPQSDTFDRRARSAAPAPPLGGAMPAATRKQNPAAATVSATRQGTTPALTLNGYNVIPASDLAAVSFYSGKSGGPVNPGLQGNQEFDLVDPATGATVGSFAAHVSQNSRTRTEMLQVTEIRSGATGTNPGDTPPVGSIIAVRGQGTRFSKVYSDMPSPDGYVSRHDRITPLRTIHLPVKYHAAYLNTDSGAANTPLDLLNGFTIAPTEPGTEVFTTVTGMPPMFTVVQGSQSYSVYDQNNMPVGHFEGLVTTTSDFTGITTKMIVVTDTGGETNVGVSPGQVPPVGTVYNVINLFNPKSYLLYQSSPTPTGTAVSTRLVTDKAVIPLKFGNLDASAPPPLTTIAVPGGKAFAPTASAPVVGVNGLPPRNMITQGYQQFDVLDPSGATVGSYDAFLTREWSGVRLRFHHEEILVAKVTDGTPGSGVGDVPPVGTVYDIRMIANSKFGDIDVATPTADGQVMVKRYLVTPFGYLPMPSRGPSAVTVAGVNFYDPFG